MPRRPIKGVVGFGVALLYAELDRGWGYDVFAVESWSPLAHRGGRAGRGPEPGRARRRRRRRPAASETVAASRGQSESLRRPGPAIRPPTDPATARGRVGADDNH